MTLQDQLNKLNACEEAQEWAAQFTTLREAWEVCPRGDWMLWIYARLRPNNLRELTLAKGHCANTVRHLMTDERSLKAVDAAIAFGEWKITINELNTAAYAAVAAAVAAAAAAAAAAAYAAVADAAYAAYAAYGAANAASDAAAAARKENQQLTADICRKYLTPTMFA